MIDWIKSKFGMKPLTEEMVAFLLYSEYAIDMLKRSEYIGKEFQAYFATNFEKRVSDWFDSLEKEGYAVDKYSARVQELSCYTEDIGPAMQVIEDLWHLKRVNLNVVNWNPPGPLEYEKDLFPLFNYSISSLDSTCTDLRLNFYKIGADTGNLEAFPFPLMRALDQISDCLLFNKTIESLEQALRTLAKSPISGDYPSSGLSEETLKCIMGRYLDELDKRYGRYCYSCNVPLAMYPDLQDDEACPGCGKHHLAEELSPVYYAPSQSYAVEPLIEEVITTTTTTTITDETEDDGFYDDLYYNPGLGGVALGIGADLAEIAATAIILDAIID